MERYKEEFIEFMIDSEVLRFGDFVTKSGRNTPFFINTGFYRTGKQLKKLGEFYAAAINENFKDNIDVLFGPAYKGIPLSVTTSIALYSHYGRSVSYCSNRKEAKDHGEGGVLLGGDIKDGTDVLIIEDVTTAGTSIRETVPLLKASGDCSIKGLIVSVDRMERGTGEKSALKEISEEFGFKSASIVTMEDVISHLFNKPYNGRVYINDEIKEKIDIYYEKYGASL